MISDANELTPAEEAAAESILSRNVQDGVSVCVRVFEQAMLAPQQKHEISQHLQQYFAAIDAARKPVTGNEHEDTIAEAIRSVRRRAYQRSHSLECNEDLLPTQQTTLLRTTDTFLEVAALKTARRA